MAAALAAAVRPFAAGGGVPRRAAPASERASGKMMPPQRVVAPARDSSVCLARAEELCAPSSQKRQMTCNRSNVVETAAAVDTKVVSTVGGGGEVSTWELLQKRLAAELDVLRGLLKKAELISRRGACNGGGATMTPGDGKKERFLASDSKQRSEPKPTEDGGGNAVSAKRRKISTLVEQKQKKKKQKEKKVRAPPRMSPEERTRLAGRLSTMSAELPEHIVEFLLKQFGDADAGGEIEIDVDAAEDSVLFELKAQLDKFARERTTTVVVDDVLVPEEKDKGEKLAEASKSRGVLDLEQAAVHIRGVCPAKETGSRPSSRSRSSSGSDRGTDRERCSDEVPALREREKAPPEQTIATSAQPPPTEPPAQAAKVGQDVVVERAAPPKAAAVYMPGLIYRANLRRQLLEMERAVLPDQSIHRPDLQRLGIGEYGHPGLMRHLGLILKADDA